MSSSITLRSGWVYYSRFDRFSRLFLPYARSVLVHAGRGAAWVPASGASLPPSNRCLPYQSARRAAFDDAERIHLVVAALLPIVSPIGGSPFFLVLTADYTAQTRRPLARRIAVNDFLLLIASFTIGSHLLMFWNFTSGGTGRWWADRDCDRLDDAEAESSFHAAL